MTPNTQQLQQLYIAYFKRPADVAGLALWETVAAAEGLEAVLPAFTHSAEYSSLYEGLSNQQVVNTLYQNLFGRDAEPAGLQFWAAALDAGTLTVASLTLAMIRGAGTNDAAALASKTAAASAFTVALDTPAKAEGYQGDAANDIARAWLATVTDQPASATAATAAMPSVLANAVDAGHGITHGKLVDGYIAGATIFADANGNGTWDAGEARTVTDARGGFTLTGAHGTLIATGGIDLATNLKFTGIMTAPTGATVVNPITTLQQTLMQQGQSVEQAQAAIAKAFGISVANIDFDQRDPLEAAFRSGASAADLALAVKMQAAAAKIQNLLVATSQALSGAIAGLSDNAASLAASKALAQVIHTDADGVVSLSDATVVSHVLTGAAEMAGATAQQTATVASIVPGFSAIMAATAKSVDTIAADSTMSSGLAQARILQVQTAVQGTVADAIHDAATKGNIVQATQHFTGGPLSDVILGTKIGDVVPGATTDSGVIEIVNGTEPDTTPPDAPSALALAAADDTGIAGDGLTRLSSGLTITGSAEADSRVDLYEDMGAGNLRLLGTATAQNGTFSIDVNLANGAHQLVARATDAADNIGAVSTALTVTVDTQGPTGLRVNDLLSYDATYVANNYGAVAAAGHNLVQVGGTNGFGTELTALNTDDNFTGIDVSALFTSGLTLGATTYNAANQVFVGVNGYMTLGVGNSSFSASGIAGYRTSPMIAAQFDDIVGGRAIAQSPGGTSTGSNHIYYDVDTVNHVLTITWDDVAPFRSALPTLAGNDYSHGNAYQIRLHQLQGSDFLIEVRYESMSWIGGNTTLPTAGWTAGDGSNYGEVQGSGTAAMLDLENTSNFGHNGVYLWEVKNGIVTDYVIDVRDVIGRTAFELSATDPTSGDVLTYSLGANADSRFSLVNGNQIAVAANAQFDLATESTVTLPVTVTDKAGNVVSKDMLITLFSTPDTTAPTLSAASPADDATGVAVNANIVLTFSETVRAGTGNFVLVDDSNGGTTTNFAVGGVTINGNTVTLDPSSDLVAGHQYHLEIASGVLQDAAGNAFGGIASATTLNFTTAPPPDTTAPLLQSTAPASGATAVTPGANLVLTFDESVTAGTGNIELWQDTGSGATLFATIAANDATQVSFNGATMTINPGSDFVVANGASSAIYVEIDAGAIVDLVGNQYAGIANATTFAFTVS